MKNSQVFNSRDFDQVSIQVKDLENGNHIFLSRKGEVVEIKPSGAAVCTHDLEVWEDNPMQPVQTWFDRLPSGKTIKKMEKVRVQKAWYPVETLQQVYATDGVRFYLLELTEFHNWADPWLFENRWVRTPLVMPEGENPVEVISDLTGKQVFSLSDFIQVFGPDVEFHEDKPRSFVLMIDLPF